MWAFDAEALSSELIRALRGGRSQPALSRRLGYASNVLYTWESGRRWPTGSQAFRLIAKTGHDPRAPWSRFAIELGDADPTTREGLVELLTRVRGTTRVATVAERCGVSRFAASRWLRGQAEPRLPELLTLIEALTLRLADFIAALVDPAELPTLRDHWRAIGIRRQVAFTHPWSQAILRALETTEYRRSRGGRAHAPWLADHLGIAPETVTEALSALSDAGLITHDAGRWVTEPIAIDTSIATAEARRDLKAHWASVGRERLLAGADGLFSWSVFAVSQADYERVRELHVAYMHSLRQIVDESSPSEVVAMVNVQLFRLDR
ncbi:MAG: DUF4423 domain-containing protein [Sandaracinaceae bacterium]